MREYGQLVGVAALGIARTAPLGSLARFFPLATADNASLSFPPPRVVDGVGSAGTGGAVGSGAATTVKEPCSMPAEQSRSRRSEERVQTRANLLRTASGKFGRASSLSFGVLCVFTGSEGHPQWPEVSAKRKKRAWRREHPRNCRLLARERQGMGITGKVSRGQGIQVR